MGDKGRWEYLRAIYGRYRTAARKAKKVILNEFCANTDYNRKYAIRLLNGPRPEKRPQQRRGKRGLSYSRETLAVLTEIWEAAGYPWSVRLKALLPQLRNFLSGVLASPLALKTRFLALFRKRPVELCGALVLGGEPVRKLPSDPRLLRRQPALQHLFPLLDREPPFLCSLPRGHKGPHMLENPPEYKQRIEAALKSMREQEISR